MLIELRIKNFAIIDQLALEFGPGLVILTGETGAGKSIIIDAVETLLGVRADSSLIRTGVNNSQVEGTFKIMPDVRDDVHAILKEEDLLDNENFVTLGREFRREGRNVVRVNGRTVTLSLLKRLGELLIDLHGQSEHLSLLRVPSHLGLLDRFAEAENELKAYQEVYYQLQAVRKELTDLRQADQDAARRQELLAFQVDEIEMAGLEPGEEASIREERTRLANAERLAEHANRALSVLDSGDMEAPTVIDQLGTAMQALEGLAKVDESREIYNEKAQDLFENVNDLVRDLGDYLNEIEFNPARLEEVEDRLQLIISLKRKYGETIEVILAFGVQAQKDLDAITHAEERLLELVTLESQWLLKLAERAIILSGKRKQAAEEMSAQIEKQLQDLKMEQARFGVDFQVNFDPNGIELPTGERVSFDARGHEKLEFMVEPNPGEGLKPLVKIASGGETARLMLALKNVLAKADKTPTLIFDEIDQGIGGRVGAVVGQKLWKLGREHQVLCITHLAQLAGYGDQHLKVDKVVNDGRTSTVVYPLDGEKRILELAQMLGDVSDGTLQSAHEILAVVREQRSRIN